MTTEQITNTVETILKDCLGASRIDHSKTWPELGLDSLEQVEAVMFIEEEFDLTIPDEEAERLAKMPVAQGIHWLEMQLNP